MIVRGIPRESRSLSGTPKARRPGHRSGRFVLDVLPCPPPLCRSHAQPLTPARLSPRSRMVVAQGGQQPPLPPQSSRPSPPIKAKRPGQRARAFVSQTSRPDQYPNASISVILDAPSGVDVMLMRMRSVVVCANVTVRLINEFDVTVASVTHAEPFQ